jgi:hypothetical protein
LAIKKLKLLEKQIKKLNTLFLNKQQQICRDESSAGGRDAPVPEADAEGE